MKFPLRSSIAPSSNRMLSPLFFPPRARPPPPPHTSIIAMLTRALSELPHYSHNTTDRRRQGPRQRPDAADAPQCRRHRRRRRGRVRRACAGAQAGFHRGEFFVWKAIKKAPFLSCFQRGKGCGEIRERNKKRARARERERAERRSRRKKNNTARCFLLFSLSQPALSLSLLPFPLSSFSLSLLSPSLSLSCSHS